MTRKQFREADVSNLSVIKSSMMIRQTHYFVDLLGVIYSVFPATHEENGIFYCPTNCPYLIDVHGYDVRELIPDGPERGMSTGYQIKNEFRLWSYLSALAKQIEKND